MTSHWMNKVDRVHRKLYEQQGDEATQQEVFKAIVKHGAKTSRDEYFNDLRQFGYIDKVQGKDKYLIEEPEGLDTEDIDRGETVQLHVKIPYDLRELIREHEMNATQLLVNGALRELNAIKDFYGKHIDVEDVSEEEIKFVLEMGKRGLLKREGRKEKRAQRQHQRHDLYEEFTGTHGVQCPERVGELRKEGFKLRHT